MIINLNGQQIMQAIREYIVKHELLPSPETDGPLYKAFITESWNITAADQSGNVIQGANIVLHGLNVGNEVAQQAPANVATNTTTIMN